jgi:hypothetical protein
VCSSPYPLTGSMRGAEEPVHMLHCRKRPGAGQRYGSQQRPAQRGLTVGWATTSTLAGVMASRYYR